MQVVKSPKDGIDTMLEVSSAVRRNLETTVEPESTQAQLAGEVTTHLEAADAALREARNAADRLRSSQEQVRRLQRR